MSTRERSGAVHGAVLPAAARPMIRAGRRFETGDRVVDAAVEEVVRTATPEEIARFTNGKPLSAITIPIRITGLSGAILETDQGQFALRRHELDGLIITDRAMVLEVRWTVTFNGRRLPDGVAYTGGDAR